VALFWVPIGWTVLYGCALCAASFFATRGLRIFGWAFILGASLALAFVDPDTIVNFHLYYSHGTMGFFFGGLHLAYGIYLYFTEKRGNES